MPTLGKIAIVGSGAIGCYYGGRLAQAGEDVHFLMRSDYAHVQEHGLRIDSVHGDFSLSAKETNAHQTPASLIESGPVDLVIVSWKATSNPHVAAIIAPLLSAHTAILTLQNGLGNCELLATHFGAHRVLGGLCFICINRLGPGHISHSASGLLRLGEYAEDADNEKAPTTQPSPRLQKLTTAFQSAQLKTEAVLSLEKAQWMKLIWNIPFNGLAISQGGVTTDQLLTERQLEPRIRALMGEIVAVAQSLGHHISADFIDQQISRTYPMGAYRPSSMIDFVEGRPVELEAIWQHPLRIAQAQKVPTPELEKLTQQIEAAL